MSLTNEKIADWIEQRYQDDYFRFEQISSEIYVTNFEQKENQLIVDYEFWDDGHANKDSPEYFLFDIDISKEYDVYFPSTIQFIKIKGTFAWKTKDECENLGAHLIEEFEDVISVNCYKWGDPEIDMFINEFIEADKAGLKDLLVNHYDAVNKGFPDFIHEVLRPHFMKVINND
jgi:hypothetical protein